MINDELAANEESLVAAWAVIEAKRSLPATIAVVGATDRDNTVAVARGLARASVLAGRRTAYFSLTDEGARDGYDDLFLPSASGAAYYERAQLWRSQYEVVIAEVPRVLATALGAQVARSADGVIVALRGDRSVVAQDRRLSSFLEQLGAQTLGVIKTSRDNKVSVDAATGINLKAMGRTLRSVMFRT